MNIQRLHVYTCNALECTLSFSIRLDKLYCLSLQRKYADQFFELSSTVMLMVMSSYFLAPFVVFIHFFHESEALVPYFLEVITAEHMRCRPC